SNIRLCKLQASERFTTTSYFALRGHLIKTLSFFFRTNRMYGKLFLACVVHYCPINILFTLWLISDDLSTINRIFMSYFVCWQIIFVFATHFALAQCTKRLHKPGKVLASLMVHTSTRVGELRARIKFSHD